MFKNCKFLLYILLCVGVHFFISCNSNNSKESNELNAVVYQFDTLAIQHFQVDASVRAIFPIDENTCWYAGSNGQYGFTEDGGKNWKNDSLQHPDQPNLAFRSIAVTDNGVFLLSIASPALLFRSLDQGNSWEVVYQENDSLAFYDAMAFWDDKDGIAMGDPTDGCLSVIKTENGGESWRKISCGSLPVAIEGEAAFAASNSNLVLHGDEVWMVSGGKAARVFHSSDRGETWEVFNTPIVQGEQMTGIFSADFYNGDAGIIIGGDWNKKEQNTSNKAVSIDGGKTWDLVADGSAPGYRSCVQFLNDQSADYVMAVGIPGISYSSDFGKSWLKLADESFYTFRKAGRIVWLAGSQKIARWEIEKKQ